MFAFIGNITAATYAIRTPSHAILIVIVVGFLTAATLFFCLKSLSINYFVYRAVELKRILYYSRMNSFQRIFEWKIGIRIFVCIYIVPVIT